MMRSSQTVVLKMMMIYVLWKKKKIGDGLMSFGVSACASATEYAALGLL